MSVTGVVGYTNVFKFGAIASPEVYTVLNGVNSISISGDKVSVEKTTTMSASSTGVDTFIPGTQDPGSCDVKGYYIPGDTSQIGTAPSIEAYRLAAQPIAFTVLYGSSNSCTFQGIIESFTFAFPLDKPATYDIKIKITGLKVYV
jgi:hypothetical protein